MHRIIPLEQNPILRQKAEPLWPSEITSKKAHELIQEMKDLLSKEPYGVALAAPQIGEPMRLFIVSGKAIARDARNAPDENDTDDPEEEPEEEELPSIPDQVFINPELIKLSRGRTGKHEGCLSIRGKWGIVPRAEKATIRALDEEGRPFTRGASGFLAHVFQHEMDHLDGILYIDKATELYDDEPDEKK
jgi:peptide deformylase